MRIDDEFYFIDEALKDSEDYHDGTGRNTDYNLCDDEWLEDEL